MIRELYRSSYAAKQAVDELGEYLERKIKARGWKITNIEESKSDERTFIISGGITVKLANSECRVDMCVTGVDNEKVKDLRDCLIDRAVHLRRKYAREENIGNFIRDEIF